MSSKKQNLYAFGNLLFSFSVIVFAIVTRIFGPQSIPYIVGGLAGVVGIVFGVNGRDWLKKQDRCRGCERLIISTGVKEELEDPTLYGIGYEQEPFKVSRIDIEDILKSDMLDEEYFKPLEEKLEKFYGTVGEPITDDPTLPRHVEGRRFILNSNVVNFKKYDIRYFAERKLESFFDKKQIKFIENNIKKEKDDKKEKLLNIFMNLDDEGLLDLETQFKLKQNKLITDPSLKQVQRFLRDSFDTFTPDEMKFFESQGILNFDDLRNQDLKQLEILFNRTRGIEKPYTVTTPPPADQDPDDQIPQQPSQSPPDDTKDKKDWRDKFRKQKWIRLEEIIIFNEEEIIEKESQFFINLSKDSKYDLYKIKASQLPPLFWRSYISHLVFEEEFFFNAHVGNGNEMKAHYASEAIFIHPAPWEITRKNESIIVGYKGWNYRHHGVSRIGVTFQFMLTNQVPVFYVNDCSYTRRKWVDDVRMRRDELQNNIIEAAVKLAIESRKVYQQLEDIIISDEVTMRDLRHTIEYMKAQSYANMDVKMTMQNLKKKFMLPQVLIDNKWLLVVICISLLILGMIIGAVGMYTYLSTQIQNILNPEGEITTWLIDLANRIN